MGEEEKSKLYFDTASGKWSELKHLSDCKLLELGEVDEEETFKNLKVADETMLILDDIEINEEILTMFKEDYLKANGESK